MKTSKLAAVVAGVALVASASAQTVEDRMSVLEAQIGLLKKEKELQDAQRAIAGTSAMGMPVVVSVSVGAQRVARLQLPNGIVGHYREGEMVKPGVVVSSISPKQVFVSVGSGKKRAAIPLDFAGPVVPGTQAQGQANVPDALLPAPPSVAVPAIEVIPYEKAAAAPKVAATPTPAAAPAPAATPAPAAAAAAAPAPAAKPAGAPPVPPALVRAGK